MLRSPLLATSSLWLTAWAVGTPAAGEQLISPSLNRTIRIWDPTAAAGGTAEAILDRDARECEARRTKKEDALQAPGVPVELVTSSHVLGEPQARSASQGNAPPAAQDSPSLAYRACKHADWILSLAISPDETTVATAHIAGPVYM